MNRCWMYLSFFLCSKLPFKRRQEGGQNDAQVTRQSVSCHSGEEGQNPGVHGRSGQLQDTEEEINHRHKLQKRLKEKN